MATETQGDGPLTEAEASTSPAKPEITTVNGDFPNGDLPRSEGRKRLVVVGLGMVGIAFM